jgi:hypothetical protein
MLFHPDHKKGQALLRAMEIQDRALIEDVLMLIDHNLEREAATISPEVRRWGVVCKQLRAQLELPPEPVADSAADKKQENGGRRWLPRLRGRQGRGSTDP